MLIVDAENIGDGGGSSVTWITWVEESTFCRRILCVGFPSIVTINL